MKSECLLTDGGACAIAVAMRREVAIVKESILLGLDTLLNKMIQPD
jgi:hypothetical protein